MAASVLEEFLVRLGFQVDKDSELKFNASITKATAAVSAMAKVVVAAGVSAGAAMLKVSTDMNRTFQMTQKSGTTMQNIGKFELAMKQMGGSAEGARRLVQGLFNQFQNYPRLAQAFETITHGVSAIDPKTGKLRDTVDILTDLAKKLQEISAANPEAGVSFARELGRNFGLSEDDLNNLMRPEFLAALGEADKLYQKIGKNMEDNARTASEISKEFTNLRTVFSAGWDEAWMGFAEGIGLADTLKDASGMIVDNFDKIKGLAKQTGKSLRDFWDTITGGGNKPDKRNMQPKPLTWRPDFSHLENDETAGSGASVLGLPSSAPVADADADSGTSDAAAVLAPAAEAVPVSDDSDGQDYGWVKKWGTSKKTARDIREKQKSFDAHRNSTKLSDYLTRVEGGDVSAVRAQAEAAVRRGDRASTSASKSVKEGAATTARASIEAAKKTAAAANEVSEAGKKAAAVAAEAGATAAQVAGKAAKSIEEAHAKAIDKIASTGTDVVPSVGTQAADQTPAMPASSKPVITKGLRSDRLGWVSEANESQGDDAAINYKDLSGFHSYGRWQIYGGGTMQKYLPFMEKMGGEFAEIAKRLSKFSINSAAFDKQWKIEAKRNPYALERSQYEFLKATHYDPVLKGFSKPLQNAITNNRALQEALWQSVVLGPGAAKGLFNKGWKEGGGDVETLIKVIYRDMHKYQRKYIAENPDHLPVLLRAHQRSMERVLAILASAEKNRPLPEGKRPVDVAWPKETQLAKSPFRSPYQTGLESLPHIAAAVDRIANGKPGTALPDATVRPLETAARTATYNSSTVNNDNRVSSPTANITVNVQGGRDVAQQTVDGLTRALDQWGFTPPGVRYAFSGGSIT